MNPIIPAVNTLWFWFYPESKRRAIHGTPEDSMRKYKLLNSCGCAEDGLELFIFPRILNKVSGFEEWFYKKIRKLKYKTIHIGDVEKDFLINGIGIYEDLKLLYNELRKMEIERIIIHAHHLKKKRKHIKKLFEATLPGINILIENNGFDDDWGSKPETLIELFDDMPELKLCLDICHIKDFEKFDFNDFLLVDTISSRISEIHFSYSTKLLNTDPYEKMGYKGYNPFHALYSVVGAKVDHKLKEILHKYPVVIEGIVPLEDRNMKYLHEEYNLIREE